MKEDILFEKYEAIATRHTLTELAIQFPLLLACVGGIFIPPALPQALDTQTKGWFQVVGLAAGAAGALYSSRDARFSNQALWKTIHAAQKALVRNDLQRKVQIAIAEDEIYDKGMLAELAALAQTPAAQAELAEGLDVEAYMPYSDAPVLEVVPETDEFAGVTIPASTAPPFTAVDWEAQAIESAMPPIRDCAYDIASLDGHVALVSKTRSGKTTLLIATIAHAQALGHEVFLIDGKGDDRLRALKNVHYLQCNTPEKVPAVDEMIEHVLEILTNRQEKGAVISHPISLFVDENNLIRDCVGDGVKKNERAATIDEYDRKLKRILLQGAAAQIYLRLSAHTSRVKDWGWDTGVLDSLTFAAIARNGSYESVEDLISHQIQGSQKELAQQRLAEIQQLGEVEAPIMLTKQHPWGFYRLPDYSKIKQPEGVAPSSGYGTKNPSIQYSQPLDPDLLAASYDPRSNPAKTAIAEMVDWMLSYKGDPGALTRDAIAAKFKAETGEYLKGEALDGLIDILKAEIRRVSGG